MIDASAVEVQQMLQDGRAAALAGDTFVARASFRQATERDPSCVDAWIGLSSVVPVLAEKREHLQRALALDPDNAEVQASLRYVEKLQAQGLRLAPTTSRTGATPSVDVAPPADVATDPSALPAGAPAGTYCYRHPERETGLRCVNCDQPICGQCSRTTPVGQICPVCRSLRRPHQYKVSINNLIVAGLVALIVSALAGVLLQFTLGDSFIGFYVIFFVAPLLGELIVRIIDRVTRVKRGRPIQIVVGAAMAVGMLPIALFGRLLYFYLALPAELRDEMPSMGMMLFAQMNMMLVIFAAIGIATAIVRLK
jgi:hypothetical protein